MRSFSRILLTLRNGACGGTFGSGLNRAISGLFCPEYCSASHTAAGSARRKSLILRKEWTERTTPPFSGETRSGRLLHEQLEISSVTDGLAHVESPMMWALFKTCQSSHIKPTTTISPQWDLLRPP